jgi:hypothetical protein
VAIGADENDERGTNAGHVRVFSFDSDSNTWVQIGKDIDGEASGDRSVKLVVVHVVVKMDV